VAADPTTKTPRHQDIAKNLCAAGNKNIRQAESLFLLRLRRGNKEKLGVSVPWWLKNNKDTLMTLISEDLAWWITVVDLPAMAGLFALIWRTRQDNQRDIDHLQNLLDRRSDQLREALAAFKLEVAKTYASHTDLRSLETRLVEHLLRIEAKLDKTALKAEALKAKSE